MERLDTKVSIVGESDRALFFVRPDYRYSGIFGTSFVDAQQKCNKIPEMPYMY